MIRVEVYIQGENIKGLKCKGHAEFAEFGKDLICASVSSILTGGFNTFQEEDYELLVLKKGNAEVVIKDNEHAKIVLETIITQLKTIEVSYPEFISINERRCKL